MVGAALNVGLTPVVIKEILFQSVPYVGVAKVFDFLHTTNAIFQEKGIELPLKSQTTTTAETRVEKGVAAQKAIFGDAIDKMRQQAPSDQSHIQDFLAANCFGDYYTRNGIDLKTRELLTFAMLISLGGCEPQVKGQFLPDKHLTKIRLVIQMSKFRSRNSSHAPSNSRNNNAAVMPI
jgi:4-carboxymuconolactone decarboxylase